MDIRAILFDADGVIQGPAPGFHLQLHDTFGIAPDQADIFLHEVVSPAERRALTGERDFLRELVAEFARENRPAPTPESLSVFTAIEVYSDVIELVRSFRSSGTHCYIASNQVPFRARYMSDVLGYRDIFDRQLYSCDLGYAKPDIEYFRAIFREIGFAGDQALFLDDHEENVVAAREAGFHASLFVANSYANRREALLRLLSRFGLQLT